MPDEHLRIRKVGGGRKLYWVSNPGIDKQFLSVLCDHTAGDPMNEKIRWTNLHGWEIVEALKNEYDIVVSRNVVSQLLKRHDYRLRKAQKRKSMKKSVPDRNEQFDYTLKLRSLYRNGNPIFPHITRACQGVVFSSLKLITDLISRSPESPGGLMV